MSQHERSSRMAVMLFTDMVDSVALQRRLGTGNYARLLQLHHQLFLQVLKCVEGGRISNDLGDGLLGEFDTAAGAVKAALLFQMLLRETKWEQEAPRVRIGIHQGQLAEIPFDPASPGKLVGMPVDIASRVMNLAQGGQILLTRPVYDDARQFVRDHPVARAEAPSPPAIRWKAHGTYLPKGGDDPIEIFEVGAAGFAPFTPPPDAEKIRRSVVLPEKAASKWSPAIGAGLAVFCGLLLWGTILGEPWENASYDYLFRFAWRLPPEKVVLIKMDNTSYKVLDQKRDQLWNRKLHAELLNQLVDAGCKLVVFDINFELPDKPEVDALLAQAMRRSNVVLMAVSEWQETSGRRIRKLIRPHEFFVSAATNWGIGNAGVPELGTPRRHWPYPPSPDDGLPSLPGVAAGVVGAKTNMTERRWLRYYGETGTGGWDVKSYHEVLTNKPSDLGGKVVFIGRDPARRDPSSIEDDKFCTPCTRWTKEAVGGVEIMATTFLNLINGDWLRRPAWWVETLVLLVTGVALGSGLCLVRSGVAWLIAAGAALAVMFAGVCLSYSTNYWFPWLVIAGGQVPLALAWALGTAGTRREISYRLAPTQVAEPTSAGVTANSPDAPDYQLFDPPFGEGGFGKVWLARNAIGQWQALKAVYQSKFGKASGPYEAEFKGIERYKPVSEKHPGLLRIDFVSRMKPEGYFYYVMELGDGQTADWQKSPATYKPWNLEFLRAVSNDGRVSLADSVRIGVALAEALDFLHREGLIHRDIKPSNVIFVNGHPKLADVGLVTEIRSPSKIHTWAGTAGFMPPSGKEPPGTVQADIFALGMLLYVISTGCEPADFPTLPTALMQPATQIDFIRLNAIILRACHPDLARRYVSAAEMRDALLEAQKDFSAQTLGGKATNPG